MNYGFQEAIERFAVSVFYIRRPGEAAAASLLHTAGAHGRTLWTDFEWLQSLARGSSHDHVYWYILGGVYHMVHIMGPVTIPARSYSARQSVTPRKLQEEGAVGGGVCVWGGGMRMPE
jgi:hypothetical protein